MTSPKKKDWSGHKYTLIKALGHDIDNIVMIKDLNTQEENWHVYSHADGDGATVTHLMFDKYKLNPKYTPNQNSSEQVGTLKKLWLIVQHLKTQGKKITYPWKAPLNPEQTQTELAYALMPKEVTDKVLAHCKTLRVGETSFYLDCLDKAASQALLSTASDRVWVMPHDVRASLNLDSKSTPGNYAAALYLRLPAQGSDAGYINTLRKSLYKRNILWGSWAYSNVSRYLSDGFITKAYLKMTKPSWFGVMSNVGNWESSLEDGSESHLAMIMCPFASPLFAVTTCMFRWENHTSISLTLNPELMSDTVSSASIAQLWLAEIYRQAGISSDQPEVESKAVSDIHAIATRMES